MDGRTQRWTDRSAQPQGACDVSRRLELVCERQCDPESRRIDPDPNMTLDYAFKTMLFWIVSRSNNCVYCMGHQETQLPAFGVAEDRIAALDGDWSEFTLAERAAFTWPGN